MKVDLRTSLKNLDGSEMGSEKQAFVVNQENQFMSDENGKPLMAVIQSPKDALTVKEICKTLLFFEVVGEKSTDDSKTKKFDLGMKIIAHCDEIDLEAKEISLLQDLAKLKYQSPILSIQFCKILDGKTPDFIGLSKQEVILEKVKEEIN